MRAANLITPETMALSQTMLERVCKEFGNAPWALMEKRHVTEIRGLIVEGSGAKNNVVKAISALFSWVNDVGLTERNPARGIKLLKSGDGFHTWTVSEVRQFVTTYPRGTKPYRLMIFFLITGLRVSGLSLLGWEHVTADGRIVAEGHRDELHRAIGPVAVAA